MNRRTQILILDNSSGLTGAFKSILLTTSALLSFNFSFALPANSSLVQELEKRNIEVLRINFIEISKRPIALIYLPMLIWNSLRILHYIRRNNITVLHVNDVYNMCGVVVKTLNPKIKLVYHVRLLPHSYIRKLYTFFVRQIAKKADAIIVVSESVRKALSDLNVSSTVIYDAIKMDEKYQPYIFKDEPSPVTLLYLANFIAGKGHTYALEAFALAQKQAPAIKMIMAGGDLGLKKNTQLKNELYRKVTELGLEDCVTFHEYVEDVEELMKSSDIFLNFSESESFSMTCLEALYFGTPCIASDSGGPSEIIEHGVSGLIVPNKNVQRMADAMIKLAVQPALRKQFSDAGRVRARTVFNIEQQSEKLRNVYLGL